MKALFFNNNKKSIWFRGKDSERGESAKYVSCSSSFCCNLNFCHKSIKFFLHTCSKPETWNTLVQRTISVHTQHLSQWSSYNFLARTGTASLSVFSTSVSTSGKFSTEGFFVPGFFFFPEQEWLTETGLSGQSTQQKSGQVPDISCGLLSQWIWGHWKALIVTISTISLLWKPHFQLYDKGWIILSSLPTNIQADMSRPLFSLVSWRDTALCSVQWVLTLGSGWCRVTLGPSHTVQALTSDGRDTEVSLLTFLLGFPLGLLVSRTAPSAGMRYWAKGNLLAGQHR